MAKGALLQLAARGIQDTFLTSNPSIHHFKKVFKQYTPFAIEQLKLDFNGDVQFGKKITCIIPKKGDLLSNMYLNVKLPPLVKTSGDFAGWTNSVGNAMIEYVELEVGGCVVDKQYGLFLEVWDELIDTKIENILLGKYDTNLVLGDSAINNTEYYVPLRFWFHNDFASSLPLISLRNHEVKIHIKLRPFSELLHYDGDTPPITTNLSDINITANYVFLHDEERKKYINSDHKFFITQLQLNPILSFGAGTKNFKTSLDFNHPCKEMIWVFTETDSEDNNDWFNFSKRVPNGDLVTELMQSCSLSLDGADRFSQNEKFFRSVQHELHHTNISNKHVYTYSFSQNPEEWTPSGSLNFSKINDAVMYFNMIDSVPPFKLYIFALTYNWFIIKKGLGAIAFNA